MQKETFITYRSCDSKQETEAIEELLKNNSIIYEVEEVSKNTQPLMFDNSEKEFIIKIKQEDYKKANELVLNEVGLDNIDPNYYLLCFSDEELIEILVKPEEWGVFDRTLAPKLLVKRGYNLNELSISSKKKEHIGEMGKAQKASPILIVAGYITAFLGAWIGFGGLIGLAIGSIVFSIGLILYKTKTTLSDGERVYSYNNISRIHGGIILFFGVIISILTIIIAFNSYI